jgi:hypothetical protein
MTNALLLLARYMLARLTTWWRSGLPQNRSAVSPSSRLSTYNTRALHLSDQHCPTAPNNHDNCTCPDTSHWR